MIRTGCRLAVLAAAAGGLLLGPGGRPAHADPGQLTLSVRASNPLAPVVTLTNRGSTPCQVAGTALGTVALSRVEQGGALVQPIVSYPAFDERLDSTVSGGLRELSPGASVQLPIPVLAAGPTGHLVETVGWSASTGPVAFLYPVRPGQPLRVDLTYDWQAALTGTPLCGAAAAIAPPAPKGPTAAPSPRFTPIAQHDAWGGWAGASLVLLLLGVLLALLVLGVLMLRSRRNGGVFVLVLLTATALAVSTRSARAADFTVDPGLQSAFDTCLGTLRQDGNDPAGLLPVLDSPGFHVRVGPADQDSHETGIPGGAFVFWDPDDRRPLSGPDGSAGPARDPCTTLYHELFHAKEDAEGGRSNFECVTDGGRSGIGTGEVNATRAENSLRAHLGLPPRTAYGGVPLPNGDCHPQQAGDRFCTENAAGPMCTCRTEGCAESTGDPHLLTFDGRRYDFQAVGEFVASLDPAGGFQIQVRQQPWPGRDDVAVTTAVALDVAGNRVEVDSTGGKLAVLVDGTAREEIAGPLPNGGALTTADTGLGTIVGVAWPDGSAATLSPIGGFGVNLSAAVAAPHAGKLQGLLGNADGVPANDLPGTTPLYPAYADTWRVTTSLFTYAVGTGTASYTDRAFPHRTTTAASVPNRAAAEAVCRQVGVSAPDVLAGCVLDVALTGQPDFAAAAAYGQQVVPAPGTPLGLPATADIYRCGTTPVGDLPGGSGSQPLRVRVPAGTAAVSFPSVTGTIGAASEPKAGADGDPGWGGTDIPPSFGLSGIRHATQALFLIGVFLPVPASPAETMDASTAEQASALSPALGQLFDIGDGASATGDRQRFTVPAGATALCLGFADASNFKGGPGYFDDNAGALTLAYQLQA